MFPKRAPRDSGPDLAIIESMSAPPIQEQKQKLFNPCQLYSETIVIDGLDLQNKKYEDPMFVKFASSPQRPRDDDISYWRNHRPIRYGSRSAFSKIDHGYSSPANINDEDEEDDDIFAFKIKQKQE